jgi:hypothetical protein
MTAKEEDIPWHGSHSTDAGAAVDLRPTKAEQGGTRFRLLERHFLALSLALTMLLSWPLLALLHLESLKEL